MISELKLSSSLRMRYFPLYDVSAGVLMHGILMAPVPEPFAADDFAELSGFDPLRLFSIAPHSGWMGGMDSFDASRLVSIFK